MGEVSKQTTDVTPLILVSADIVNFPKNLKQKILDYRLILEN